MVKMLGLILVVSSLLSLAAGTFFELRHGNEPNITGNAISNIFTQAHVRVSIFDYIEGTAFSYSIISLTIGVIFLFKI